MFAYIENGIVRQVVRVDPATLFAPGHAAQFIACPEDVQTGWSYADGVFSAPPVPPPSLADYDAALTAHLDAEARTRNYADRISCAVRAGYPGPFHDEGVAFAAWMDTCNATGYQLLAQFQQGLIPQPSIEDVIAALPEMVWPS